MAGSRQGKMYPCCRKQLYKFNYTGRFRTDAELYVHKQKWSLSKQFNQVTCRQVPQTQLCTGVDTHINCITAPLPHNQVDSIRFTDGVAVAMVDQDSILVCITVNVVGLLCDVRGGKLGAQICGYPPPRKSLSVHRVIDSHMGPPRIPCDPGFGEIVWK